MTSTTIWLERPISRRSPLPCTRAGSAHPTLLADVATAGRAAVDRLTEIRRPVDFLLSGMTARIIDGPGAGSAHLRVRTGALERPRGVDRRQGPQLALSRSRRNPPRTSCGTTPCLQQIATDTVRRARDAGALAVLPPALAYRAGVHVYMGEFNIGGKASRRGRRDHRVDRLRAEEVPLAEPRRVAGRTDRGGRSDRRRPQRREPRRARAGWSV